MSKIRTLRSNDIPHLLDLSTAAGWNQTAADWERLLHLCRDNCWGIEIDGRVVSSTTAIRYASDLAWIGMVLTHPEYRKRGLASSLMQHAIDDVRKDVKWIKLDASDEGKPIYEKLGFVEETHLQRWRRPAGPADRLSSYMVHDYIVDPSFDRAYFGAYRIPLLNSLRRDGGSSFVMGYGYAMTRPGALASYLARALCEHPRRRGRCSRTPSQNTRTRICFGTCSRATAMR